MKLKEIIKIERKIIIGLMINTKYLKQAIEILDIKYVQSPEAKILVTWVYDYYKKYKKAPKKNIQEIFFEKLTNNKIQKAQAEIIESILDNLSEESLKSKANVKYLMDQTETYCKVCYAKSIMEQADDELDNGNVLEAEHLLSNFKPPENIKSNAVTPLGTPEQIKAAFESIGKPLIKYPGALGDMLNPHMVAEGFVVFLGPSKGGKSFLLMDAAIRAAKQGKNVAFFQAGDMSQRQMERRQAIYLSKKSDLQKYCGPLYVPILDCIHNQIGTCELIEREGGKDMDSPFSGLDKKKVKQDITSNELKEVFEDYEDHVPCYNCLRSKKYSFNFNGSIWYRKRKLVEPLTWKDANRLVNKKHKSMLSRIKLITSSSEALTMQKQNAELDILEKQGFFSHVIIGDYLDIYEPDRDTLSMSLRDQENKKWQRGRRLSQDRNCLYLSGSQCDAPGLTKKFLSKENFSNDKRKLDHVTAMFGINMTDEEKRKGISRINDIAARETEGASFVYCLHRLQLGRPILGSFY